MAFLNVSTPIWLMFGGSLLATTIALIWAFRNVVRKFIYSIKCPEKLLKVVVHYEGRKFRNFWRIIPDSKFFSIQKKRYYYDNKYIIDHNEIFTKKDHLVIEGKKYDFNKVLGINPHRSKFIEIHYYYNNPIPINFDPARTEELQEIIEKGSKDQFIKPLKDIPEDEKNVIGSDILSGFELERIYENDLFVKLLTLRDEKNLMQLIFFACAINVLMSAFIIAKMLNLI